MEKVFSKEIHRAVLTWVFHVVYEVQKRHEAPSRLHSEEVLGMSLIVFLLGYTGRNIFLGHGKEGVAAQSQVRETMACLVAPVRRGFVWQRVCYTHQHIHRLQPAQPRMQGHESAHEKHFLHRATPFELCSRIDSLVFRKRVTTNSCWASETLSVRLVIPRALVICHAPMKYLSAINRGIAMSNKVLWQCYDLWVEITKICTVFNHTNCVRSGTSKQACSRWRTNGFLAICSKKTSALFCKPVEIWAVNAFVAIATKFRPQIINCNKKNIRTTTFLSWVRIL